MQQAIAQYEVNSVARWVGAACNYAPCTSELDLQVAALLVPVCAAILLPCTRGVDGGKGSGGANFAYL